jgi:uncharacterized membrane protein YoaK (UPF0700 family)
VTARRQRYRRARRARFAIGIGFTFALAALAGMTDVVGLILVGQYVSFMSGNTTQFGLALARGEGGEIVFLAALLATFVAGNALGEIVMRLTGRRHPPLLVIAAALTAAPLFIGPLPWSILPAVLGMGMLNAGLEQIDGLSFSVTFVTGALSRFGRALGRAMMGEPGRRWGYQIVPWLGMLAGAVAGAFAYGALAQNALAVAALWALALALLIHFVPLHWRRRFALPARGRARP